MPSTSASENPATRGRFVLPFGWSLALAALVQLALFAYASGPGLGGTSDSAYYLHAAGTLRTLGRLLHPDGTPYRYWPPLYPVLAVAAGSLGALRLLHGACLLAGLTLWSLLGHRLLTPGRAALLPWLLACSTPWIVVSKFVWGETVFIALFAGYAWALFQWLSTGRFGWLLAATGLAVLLPLQRTIGMFLLLGIGAGLLRAALRQPRLRPGVLLQLGLAAAAGLAWHYYALLLAAPSVYAANRGWPQVLSSMADYGYVLVRWLLPLLSSWRAAVPGWGWALLLPVLLAALWPRSVAGRTKPGADAGGTSRLFARLLWAGLLSFLVLIVASAVSTRSAAGPHDGERYASVLYAPVMLLVLRRWPVLSGWRGVALQAALLLVLGYNVLRGASNASFLRNTPVFTWPDGKPAGGKL